MEDGEVKVRAVKIIRHASTSTDAEPARRTVKDIELEIEIWRHLEHDHILQLIDVIQTETCTFLIMPLVNGGFLSDFILRHRKARVQDKLNDGTLHKHLPRLLAQLASAVEYLHEEMGIVHGEITLRNIVFSRSEFP